MAAGSGSEWQKARHKDTAAGGGRLIPRCSREKGKAGLF